MASGWERTLSDSECHIMSEKAAAMEVGQLLPFEDGRKERETER